VPAAVRAFQLSSALREIWDVIGATNRYIVTRQPWALAKTPDRRAELETALFVAADTLRVIAELLRPFVPGTAERTLSMLGIEPQKHSWTSLARGTLAPGTKLGETSQLFPRIEQTVEELRQMADAPQVQPPAPGTPAAPGTPHPAPGPASPEPQATSPDGRISIDDFMRVELRVARVLQAERVPKSTRLLKLLVDAGSEQRTIVAGIAESYEPETLVGRTVAVVFNLKPAKLMGVESNGMVLAASPEGGKATLVSFDDPPAPGTRVR
jgi:methionyl-tRNA synthetase